jgi:integrase
MESVLLDAAGHRRSPATMPGYHRGRPPRNKRELNPADPPTVEEIVAVMRSTDERAEGYRVRALIVLLWRAGLRISEALSLHEGDLDRSRGAVLVRRVMGGKRREVGMDRFAAGSRLERCCVSSMGRPPADAAPAPSATSAIVRLVSSEARRPVCAASRVIAWSRRPVHVVRSGAARSASSSAAASQVTSVRS